MLPLKDNIPTDRLPLVTLLLIAACAIGCLLVDGGAAPLLASAAFLWIFGTSVEDAMSRPRFAALCALGAGAAIGLGQALGAEASPALAAATGVTGAAVGGHARLYLRARVVTMLLVPFAFRLLELPMWTLLLTWAAVQAAFALTPVAGPLGDGGAAALAEAAAGCALGLAAAGALAQRRKQPPAPSAIPAWS